MSIHVLISQLRVDLALKNTNTSRLKEIIDETRFDLLSNI